MSSGATKGGVDDSVQNLERFIALVMSTVEQVQGHATTLEEAGDLFETLQGDADAAFEQLNGSLSDIESRLETAEDQVEQEIAELRQEAQEGVDQRLEEASDALERAEDAWDQALGEARSGLEDGQSDLADDGFSALESTLESVESALAEDREEAEGAFDAFESAVTELQQRAAEALTGAEGGFDAAVDEVRDRRNALETDGGDAVAAFDAIGDDIDAEARSVAGALETSYDGWMALIEVDAQDLVDNVTNLATELAGFLDAATDDQLGESTEAVLDGAFEPYLSELAELQAGLEGASATAADSLLPLVDELERAEAVIETIDKLLDTLES